MYKALNMAVLSAMTLVGFGQAGSVYADDEKSTTEKIKEKVQEAIKEVKEKVEEVKEKVEKAVKPERSHTPTAVTGVRG